MFAKHWLRGKEGIRGWVSSRMKDFMMCTSLASASWCVNQQSCIIVKQYNYGHVHHVDGIDRWSICLTQVVYQAQVATAVRPASACSWSVSFTNIYTFASDIGQFGRKKPESSCMVKRGSRGRHIHQRILIDLPHILPRYYRLYMLCNAFVCCIAMHRENCFLPHSYFRASRCIGYSQMCQMSHKHICVACG
jgi:hypothetical protein